MDAAGNRIRPYEIPSFSRPTVRDVRRAVAAVHEIHPLLVAVSLTDVLEFSHDSEEIIDQNESDSLIDDSGTIEIPTLNVFVLLHSAMKQIDGERTDFMSIKFKSKTRTEAKQDIIKLSKMNQSLFSHIDLRSQSDTEVLTTTYFFTNPEIYRTSNIYNSKAKGYLNSLEPFCSEWFWAQPSSKSDTAERNSLHEL